MNGRVAAGIPVTRYVPPPSQNRTWSVTPSGSQLESFAIGRVKHRPLRETNKFGCHAQSPLSVGACFPCPLSQTGTPSLPQHYPRSSLLWVPPTPRHLRLLPRCSGLSEGAHILAVRRCLGLLGYRAISVSGSIRLIYPGWVSPARQCADETVACWRLETIGHLQCGHFGTYHLHGRHHPFPLRLACFRTYASSTPLPPCLQGSIPGPWLPVTRTGFTPARFRDIAKPQPRPDPVTMLDSKT